MLAKNVGSVDRVVRIAVGLALLAAFFMGLGGSLNWLLLIGVVPLITGVMKTCPAYTLFGIKTCSKS